MRARRVALVLAGSLLAAVQLQGSAQAAPSGPARSCTSVTMDVTPHRVHAGGFVGFEATAQNCGSATLLVRQQSIGPCGFTYHAHRGTRLSPGTGFGEGGELIAPSCLGTYSMHIAMFDGSGTLIDSAVSRFRVVA